MNVIHTYSVEERFLQVDGVENIWGDAQTIATKIQDDMKREFGLPYTVGIEPNMPLAGIRSGKEVLFWPLAIS